VTVLLLVETVEVVRELLHRLFVERSRRHRDPELVPLADVATVGCVDETDLLVRHPVTP
jgi:hypothetical protein